MIKNDPHTLRRAEQISAAQKFLSEYIPCARRLENHESDLEECSYFPAIRHYLKDECRAAMLRVWRKKVDWILAAIALIPNPLAQIILDCRYVRGWSLERTFERAEVGHTKGRRLHAEGLLFVSQFLSDHHITDEEPRILREQLRRLCADDDEPLPAT